MFIGLIEILRVQFDQLFEIPGGTRLRWHRESAMMTNTSPGARRREWPTPGAPWGLNRCRRKIEQSCLVVAVFDGRRLSTSRRSESWRLELIDESDSIIELDTRVKRASRRLACGTNNGFSGLIWVRFHMNSMIHCLFPSAMCSPSNSIE